MKTLTLVRHAKSSWKNPSLNDHDRPLNKRGSRDAPVMADRLKRAGVRPDLVVSSSARRALTTAQTIAPVLGITADQLQVTREVYLAGTSSLIEIIRAFDDTHDHVMLVGHNPGLTDLVNHLAGADVDNVPTCGVAILQFDLSSWADIARGRATLLRFDYPKKPKG